MFRVGVMRVDGDGEGKRTRGGFPISRDEILLVMNSHALVEEDGWLRCTLCHARNRPRARARFQWCLGAPPAEPG